MHQQHNGDKGKEDQKPEGGVRRIVGVDQQHHTGRNNRPPGIAVAKDRPDPQIGEPPDQEADLENKHVIISVCLAAEGRFSPSEQPVEHKVDLGLQGGKAKFQK